MAIKQFRRNFNIRRTVDFIRSDFRKEACKVYKREIINGNILKGISPVKGEGAFERYSTSYTDAILAGRHKSKKINPINLKLSGKLLRSFKCRIQGNRITIAFSNFLAVIHNSGLGRMPERRMLPTENGEEFNRSIELAIQKLITRLVNKFIKK